MPERSRQLQYRAIPIVHRSTPRDIRPIVIVLETSSAPSTLGMRNIVPVIVFEIGNIFATSQSGRSGCWACRRFLCGRDAVQSAGGCCERADCPITFVVSVAGSGEAMARVIEFYVPGRFRKQNGRWMPAHVRGKLILFQVAQKTSG